MVAFSYSSGANQRDRAGARAEAELRKGTGQADARKWRSVPFFGPVTGWDFVWWAHPRSINAAGMDRLAQPG
jgi:hypothetical protein